MCALDLSQWGPERVIVLMPFKACNNFCLVLLEWPYQRVCLLQHSCLCYPCTTWVETSIIIKYLTTHYTDSGSNYTLWSRDGNQGNQWLEGYVNVAYGKPHVVLFRVRSLWYYLKEITLLYN